MISTDPVNGASVAADNRPEFPSGFKMFTSSATPPPGWTQVGTNNNRGIRITSGAGGAQGGSATFTDIFTTRGLSGTVNGTAITVLQMPPHNHPGNPLGNNNNDNLGPPSASSGQGVGAFYDTTTVGGGQSHDHSVTLNNLNMSLAYLDVMEIQRN